MAYQNDPMVKVQRHRRLLGQIIANGGFYVTDCHPWAIKADCDQTLCPMRRVAMPPHAEPEDLLIQCDPVGDLSDLLVKILATTDLVADSPLLLVDLDCDCEANSWEPGNHHEKDCPLWEPITYQEYRKRAGGADAANRRR